MSSAETALPCRVLAYAVRDGATNMAIDEALLERAAAGEAAVRFYGWARPTLSLGYFQRVGDRALHPPSLNCDLVRRPSGGGAIMHDRELTYSVALPAAHRLAREAATLYRAVHQTLVELFEDEWGIATQRLEGEPPKSEVEPFLCFQRRASGDLLLGDAKIGGSAQRRMKGGILQHGSILLARSEAAPELPGIAELAEISIAADVLTERWLPRLLERLGLTSGIDAEEGEIGHRARQIALEKYSYEGWTNRR